jgi:hypothetical protein
LAGVVIYFFLASAQTSGAQQPGQVDQSQSVVRSSPSVEAAAHHDVSPPLYLIPPAPRQAGQRVHPVKPIPRRINGGAVDPVVQESAPTILAPAPVLNFDGVGNGFSGPAGTFSVAAAPPDTEGDVGPNHYVQIVNTDFAVFNKSGTAIYGPVPINTLWSGFGGLCQTDNDGDPVVVYDPIADRWVISQFAVTGADGGGTPFLECVAVSQTPDPTGAYNRYSFAYNSFNDYPKMGVWPDAYYTTFNFFNAAGTAFLGGEVCAYDRASMLAGAAATQQCFNVGTSLGGLLPADLDGARQPPAGSPNYVLALGATDGMLAFWKFHVDWTTPANTTLTGPTTLTTAAYTLPCGDTGGTCIPQAGTTQQLDTLGDRLMFRLAYRNFGDHEALVANHSVTAGSSVGVRWYEIRSPGTTPTIFQQGTYAPDSNFRWMGSIAMDQNGNMALGFSLSGTALHPAIHYTGRLAGDPAGQMAQGEGTIINGAGSQTTNLNRWGDYSMMGIDPSDDCTFWYTNEYIPSDGTFNWSTRIGSFKFPGCPPLANDFSISANPTSLSLVQGTSGMSTISTAVTSGSAETVNLTVSGAPSGATASLSPTSVTAGGSSTLTVNAGTAAAGTYTLTVTGTAASATHMTTVTLTVSAATATHFAVSAPGTAMAGTAFNFTVTARDALNNIATGYRGTVHFTSSDGQAVLPVDYTFTAADSGVHTFSATLKTMGSQTITATDTGNAAITGTSNAITVSAATATHFAVSAPGTATAGTAFNFTATAKDAFNNTVTGYAGTVHFTSTDSQAVLPANATLTSGTGTFSATLKTAGNQRITATDTANATITGTSTSIVVSAGSPASIAPTGGTPQSTTINTAFATPLQATVKDSGGNPVPSVTVTFTAPASGASGTFANGTASTTAPTNGSGVATSTTFTANASAGGPYNVVASATGATSANFSLTNTASASASITLVQHASIDAGTTTSRSLAFNANNAAGNWIGVVIRAGQSGEVFAVADSRGNAYRKAIQFNETVDGTTLGVFYAENIGGGANTVTVSDTISGTLRFAILEYSGVAIANSLDGAAIAAQGTSASPNSGNLTTTTNGDLLLGEIWTANPANFSAGSGYLIEETVPAEPNTKVIVEDQVQAIAGSTSARASLGVSDNWGAALAAFRPSSMHMHFAVSAPGTVTAGSAFNFTVTAQDAFNSTVTSYTGTVHFTSSDGQAVLPADYTFTAADSGVHTFSATLKTAGSQTITATDTGNATITGTSTNIVVSAGLPASIAPTRGTPQSATINTAFATPLQATVKDSGGNAVPSVTVTFTAPGSGASGTFANGTGTTTATTNGSGVATASTFTANGTEGGPYTVMATVAGVATAANFSLTNTPVGVGGGSTPTIVQYYSQSQIGQFQLNQGFNNGGTFSIRLPNKTLSGNALIVAFQGHPDRGTSCTFATSDITDDGSNSYAAGPTANQVTDNQFAFIFIAANIAAGTQVISVKDTSCGPTVTGLFSAQVIEVAHIDTSSPLDASSSNTANTATSVTAGSMTPTLSGDFLFQVVFRSGGSQVATSFTAGSQPNITWALNTGDILVGQATQIGVYNSTSAINPTMTMAGSADYLSLAIALKPSSAGTLPAAGIHVVGEVHENVWNGQARTQTIQWPTQGKCMIATILTGGTAYHLSSNPTDDNSDTWNNTGAPPGTQPQHDAQIFYATNTTPGNRTLTLTWNATSPGHGTIILDDVGGVTQCNFDVDVTSAGNQTVAGNITFSSITPTNSPGLIITCTGNDNTTIGGFNDATQPFIASTWTGESTAGPVDIDENNGFGHYYNPDTSAVTFVWTEFYAVAAGTWGGRAAAFH